MTNKEYALYYLGRGLCVMPACSPDLEGHNEEKCGRSLGKHPLLHEWSTFQKRKPTVEEVEKWWTEWPEANIIIVAGEVSNNLVIVDVDDAAAYDKWCVQSNFVLDLESTWMYKTGGGGLHAHFRTSFPAKKRKFDWGEIQGEGTYVIVPPSKHQSGDIYEPVLNDATRIVGAPATLEALLRGPSVAQAGREGKEYVLDLVQGLKSLSKGERVDKLVAYGGRLVAHGLDPDEANDHLWLWNKSSRDPLSVEEFDSMVAPAAKRYAQRRIEELRKLQELKTPDEDEEAVSEIPSFPKEVMKGILGEVVSEFDKIREGASEFYFATLAQQALTASGNYIEFQTADGEIIDRKPKFFLVIAAPTGHHKSTAVDDMNNLMKQVIRGTYLVKAGARGSGEGLDSRLKDRKTMIVSYDEFKTLLKKKKQDANTLVDELTRLFEETTIEGMTVKDTEEIQDVFLNFTGLVTIKDLKRVITSDLDEGGFLNRIFFVVGRDKSIRPNKVKLDDKVRDRLMKKLWEMFRKYGTAIPLKHGLFQSGAEEKKAEGSQPEADGQKLEMPGGMQDGVRLRRITRSKEAEKIFAEWYTRLRKTDEDMSYGIRLDNYYNAWEVALTMSNMDDVVTKETALDVVKILDYELAIRKWIWEHIQDGSNNEWAFKVMEKVRENPGASRGRLRYLLHGDRNTSAFNAGMDQALKAGMIEKMTSDQGKEVFVPGGIE